MRLIMSAVSERTYSLNYDYHIRITGNDDNAAVQFAKILENAGVGILPPGSKEYELQLGDWIPVQITILKSSIPNDLPTFCLHTKCGPLTDTFIPDIKYQFVYLPPGNSKEIIVYMEVIQKKPSSSYIEKGYDMNAPQNPMVYDDQSKAENNRL